MSNAFSQHGKTKEFDALVIGTGLAGLHYCLELTAYNPNIKVALVTKARALESNSRYAQGGIASVSVPEDSIESHIEDTLLAGDGLCYRPSVEQIVHKGPQAIAQLLNHGVSFNQNNDNRYLLAKEGGHSFRRIFNYGDQTGFNITSTLIEKVLQNPQIECIEDHIAINLITKYHPHQTNHQGEVLGAYILDCQQNQIHTFLAHCVILATGGAGKTFRYTTNPMVATGDGVAMAYRAGARVGNMEFYQFHPTLLHHHTLNNFLISEAVRGEGGILRHPESFKPFMAKYAPQKLDLATRDIVARAIFNEIEHSDQSCVYLDITQKSRSFLQKRFPNIYHTLSNIGIDMSQDFIPVVPAAHYQCGGVLTNTDGQTDRKILFAVGEVAFTGLHGANRLASNSLLEAVVMASNAAKKSITAIKNPLSITESIPSWSSPSDVNPRRASQINAHWRSLRGEMTSYAGIVRTEAGLDDLLQLIISRTKIIEEYYWKHAITRDFVELRNIMLNAELIVRAALLRRESRGGHYREDFPNKHTHAKESIARLNSPQFPFS